MYLTPVKKAGKRLVYALCNVSYSSREVCGQPDPAPRKRILRRFNILFIAVFFLALQLNAKTYSQAITISVEKASLPNILENIAQQSGYRFFYDANILNTQKIDFHVKEQPLKEVLDRLLSNSGDLGYTIEGKTIVLRKKKFVKLIQTPLRGKVLNEQNQPVAGASVFIKGTTLKTVADENGNFSFNRIPADAVLVLTAIGFERKEISVGNNSFIQVALLEVKNDLEEVVVVAYGTSKKEAITGAVATVSAADIAKRPITSVTSVLEGAAPGIQVNNSYGEPGANPTVRIRGFTSVNGNNDPMYVIDGVQFNGNITDLNPNDIESISVLKDATSAALYGNRASNGVIVITTKKGKQQNARINAVVNQGIYERGIAEYDRMGANDFMETMWTGYRNYLLTSLPGTYTTVEAANEKASSSLISDYLYYNIYNKGDNELFDGNGKLVNDAQIRNGYKDDLDWYKGVERTGYRQDYNVSGGAGSDKSNFYFSGGYLDEKGYVKRSDFKRFTGRMSGEVSPKKWIKAGFSLGGSHQMSNQSAGSSDDVSSFANPFMFARNIAPIYPVHLHDMATGEYLLDETGSRQYDDGFLYTRPQYAGRHVTWEYELDKNRFYRNTLMGQAYTEIRFLKDFTFTVRGDLNVRNNERQTYNNALIGDGAGNNGRASRTIYRYKNYTFQQQLAWNKSFGDHSLDILAGHENYRYNENYLYGYKTTETFAGETELVNFSNITNLTDYQHNYTTESYLSRARYGFKDKYFADASIRRDGSSRFYADNRWGNFWSIGGSWILSKEGFMQFADKVDDLKIRASYGEVGNDQSVGYYAYMALYTIQQNNNKAALYKIQNEAKDIKWETAQSFSAAVEGRLYDRLNFVVEYFDKRSKDLLFDVNLPLSAGGTSTDVAEATISKNIGTVSNRGFEATIDIDVIRNNNFRWNLGTNLTVMKNKIVRLPEENREKGIINGTKKYMEGHSIYDFWMYQYVGVDQMTGNALYLPDTEQFNVNGSSDGEEIPSQYLVQIGDQYYTTYTTYAKRDWSGSVIPKIYGSFSTALSYKAFSLSALFTYALGGKTVDYSYQSLMSMSGTPSALHTDLLNAWSGVPAGMTESSANRIDPDGVPVVDFARSNFNNATSTRFLKSGSYLVVKNISLGYRMPKTITDKLDVNGLSFNLSVENLATFTALKGMNPQQSFNGTSDNVFVTPRVFSLGLNLAL